MSNVIELTLREKIYEKWVSVSYLIGPTAMCIVFLVFSQAIRQPCMLNVQWLKGKPWAQLFTLTEQPLLFTYSTLAIVIPNSFHLALSEFIHPVGRRCQPPPCSWSWTSPFMTLNRAARWLAKLASMETSSPRVEVTGATGISAAPAASWGQTGETFLFQTSLLLFPAVCLLCGWKKLHFLKFWY